jgi:hypothetical protein
MPGQNWPGIELERTETLHKYAFALTIAQSEQKQKALGGSSAAGSCSQLETLNFMKSYPLAKLRPIWDTPRRADAFLTAQ